MTLLDKPRELMSHRERFRMRRALASLLLALFSLPLIVPVPRADASSMPSCCRREGKHRCAMHSAAANLEGPALLPIQPECANYPSTIAARGNASIAFFKNPPSICVALRSSLAVEKPTAAPYRITFSRSRQKRGPPALFS
jgi:hypothetical protein